MDRDTIAAVSTAQGAGGIAIVRVSGPEAWRVGAEVFMPAAGASWPLPERRLVLGWAVDPDSGERLDQVLCAAFSAPRSYSTEDAVELHCHGGPAAARRVLDLCLDQGARLARPGEFTRRAFLGGRVSLDQAEAVAEMIAAQSAAEARLAAAALAGGLAGRLREARRTLTAAAAAVEVAVDFPDEAEEARTGWPGQARAVDRAAREMARLARRGRELAAYRQGALVVICGRPNAGKSSLFNALLRRPRAIVTELPGTTRDALEETALLGGVSCRLVDTAGLHPEPPRPEETGSSAGGRLERLGMEVAREHLSRAEVALVVLDRSRPLQPADREILQGLGGRPTVVAANKCDLPPAWAASDLPPLSGPLLEVSALTGQGLEELSSSIGRAAAGGQPEPAPGEPAANRRQAEALSRAAAHASRAASGLAQGTGMQPELVSLDLADALAALSEVDGRGAPDAVIDAVFERFCVGK